MLRLETIAAFLQNSDKDRGKRQGSKEMTRIEGKNTKTRIVGRKNVRRVRQDQKLPKSLVI